MVAVTADWLEYTFSYVNAHINTEASFLPWDGFCSNNNKTVTENSIKSVFTKTHALAYSQRYLIINLRLENCTVKMIENSFMNYLVIWKWIHGSGIGGIRCYCPVVLHFPISILKLYNYAKPVA